MKAIGYVRVSTAGQAEDGVSFDAQEAKVRSWADLNGADEVVIFRDEGVSGKRADNRPGLQAALNAAGKGDALIVYSLSRLSRSIRDTLAIADALAKKKADLVSLSEKIDTTTAAGEMVFNMLAVLSQFERKQIGERTRFALAHKKVNGEKTGGDVPFGYKVHKGKLYDDAEEQKAIDMILLLRASGASLRAICRQLAEAGIARKRGSLSWHPQIVSDILNAAKERKAA